MQNDKPSMTVCGRAYEVRVGGKYSHAHATAAQRDNYSRKIIVEGIAHPKGAPIKFRSVSHAERHIKNMRLEKR